MVLMASRRGFLLAIFGLGAILVGQPAHSEARGDYNFNITAVNGIKIIPMRNRTCPDHDFCDEPDPPKGPERRQAGFGAIAAALAAAVASMGQVVNAGDAVNGLIQGALTNALTMGQLIEGGVELAKIFGLGPKVNSILINNICTKCELWVRCTSEMHDSYWIPLDPPDGYILKFVTHLPGWDAGIGNIGLVNYNCEYRDEASGKTIRLPGFGGKAPRELVNLFEVRNRGLYRMDQETGRIDARQPVTFWKDV